MLAKLRINSFYLANQNDLIKFLKLSISMNKTISMNRCREWENNIEAKDIIKIAKALLLIIEVLKWNCSKKDFLRSQDLEVLTYSCKL